jgi:hypothetical protein
LSEYFAAATAIGALMRKESADPSREADGCKTAHTPQIRHAASRPTHLR